MSMYLSTILDYSYPPTPLLMGIGLGVCSGTRVAASASATSSTSSPPNDQDRGLRNLQSGLDKGV
jgi:hypothetical protein